VECFEYDGKEFRARPLKRLFRKGWSWSRSRGDDSTLAIDTRGNRRKVFSQDKVRQIILPRKDRGASFRSLKKKKLRGEGEKRRGLAQAH